MNQMQSMKIRRDSPHHSLAHAQRMQQLRRMELMQKQLYQRKMHQSAKRGGVVLSQIRPGLRDWYGINPAGVDVGRMQMEARLQRDQANFAQMQKFEETRLKFNGQSAKNSTQVTAGHNAQALAEIKRIQTQGLTGQQIARNEAAIAGDRSAIEAGRKFGLCQKLMGAVGAIQRLMNSTLFQGAPRGADPPSPADAALVSEIMGNNIVRDAVARFDPNRAPPFNVAYKQQLSLKIQQLLRECNILQQDASLSQDARRQVVPVIAGPLVHFPQPPTRQRGRRGNARFQENRRHGGPPGVGPGPRVEWPQIPDFHGGPGGGPPPGPPPPPGPGGLPPGIPIGPAGVPAGVQGPIPQAVYDDVRRRIVQYIHFELLNGGIAPRYIEDDMAEIFPLALRNVIHAFPPNGIPNFDNVQQNLAFQNAVQRAIDEVYEPIGEGPAENKHDEKQREVKEEADRDIEMELGPNVPSRPPMPSVPHLPPMPRAPSHPFPSPAPLPDLGPGAPSHPIRGEEKKKGNTVSFIVNTLIRNEMNRIFPSPEWPREERVDSRNRVYREAERDVLDLFRRVRGMGFATLEDIGVPSKAEKKQVLAIVDHWIRQEADAMRAAVVPEGDDDGKDVFDVLPMPLPEAVPAGTQVLENRPGVPTPGQSGIHVEPPPSMPFQPSAPPAAAEPSIGPGVHEQPPPPNEAPSSGVLLPPVLPPPASSSSAPHPSAPRPGKGKQTAARTLNLALSAAVARRRPGTSQAAYAEQARLYDAAHSLAETLILAHVSERDQVLYENINQVPPFTKTQLKELNLRAICDDAVETALGEETESEAEDESMHGLFPSATEILIPVVRKDLMRKMVAWMKKNPHLGRGYLEKLLQQDAQNPNSAGNAPEGSEPQKLWEIWLEDLSVMLHDAGVNGF